MEGCRGGVSRVVGSKEAGLKIKIKGKANMRICTGKPDARVVKLLNAMSIRNGHVQ